MFCLYFEGWAESYDYTLVPMGSYETPDALTATAVAIPLLSHRAPIAGCGLK
jgi:hypothetical protein